MIMQRLRAETKVTHQNLEKLLIPYIKSANSGDSYLKLLSLFYGYFKPVEQQIEQYIDSSFLPDFDERRKSHTIIKDIQSVNAGKELPMICSDLPSINGRYEALGALYVLEGSTLGGQVISKMLKNSLGFENNDSLAFFSGYGDDTENRWAIFSDIMNKHVVGPTTQNETVSGANETFIKFRHWVEGN